jgi:serine/threonine-protein kinase RsbT
VSAAGGTVPVRSDIDVAAARQQGRALAAELGMSAGDQTLVATAISEVARNIVAYGGKGEITLSVCDNGGRKGVEVVARDQGPGIADVELALKDGYSTGNSLGLGLPGARRLMDEFEIDSVAGEGTTITMRKWQP